MGVFCYSVWQGASYCLQKEVERLWDLEKMSRVGMEYCWSLTLQTTALFEASTESISTWLGRIRNRTSEGWGPCCRKEPMYVQFHDQFHGYLFPLRCQAIQRRHQADDRAETQPVLAAMLEASQSLLPPGKNHGPWPFLPLPLSPSQCLEIIGERCQRAHLASCTN